MYQACAHTYHSALLLSLSLSRILSDCVCRLLSRTHSLSFSFALCLSHTRTLSLSISLPRRRVRFDTRVGFPFSLTKYIRFLCTYIFGYNKINKNYNTRACKSVSDAFWSVPRATGRMDGIPGFAPSLGRPFRVSPCREIQVTNRG